MSFIRTGFREIALKIRRQRTRMALRHERRLLQKSEIALGREGTSQAANFPELRNEIVALKKLEQEQKEVALRIGQIEEGIKKIASERQQNTREQNEAIGKLEAEKKPVLQRRAQAKTALDLCERELAAVERRVEDNDAADRELLKKLAELQAITPPPADLETQTAGIAARRARLPEERAELLRARMGGTEAVRQAKEKLNVVEAELAVMEKNIEVVRADFQARDRKLEENIGTQQEAVRDAREHHEVVEERKNPAYLNIGRHLGSQGIAPPNAPQLLKEVQRHRAAVDRHVQHTAELALYSSQIDKQELRKFYFSAFSVVILLSITLFFVFKSPKKRDWLPHETETILAINIEQFERNDLPKRWRKDDPDTWARVWSGLVGPAARTPNLDLSRDAARTTRALTTDEVGRTREFVLVEARRDLTRTISAIDQDNTFEKHTINGLAVWERPDLAISRVGPTTLAVGASSEVSELVRVRMGMEQDLKITGQLFDRFHALDRESALRLISRSPPDLARVFQPIFTTELLDSAQVLGLAIALQTPVRAMLLVKLKSAESATEMARNLQTEPNRWLRIQDSELLLFSQKPGVQRQDENLELRFTMPENSARLVLQRVGNIRGSTVITAQ